MTSDVPCNFWPGCAPPTRRPLAQCTPTSRMSAGRLKHASRPGHSDPGSLHSVEMVNTIPLSNDAGKGTLADDKGERAASVMDPLH